MHVRYEHYSRGIKSKTGYYFALNQGVVQRELHDSESKIFYGKCRFAKIILSL